MCAFFYVVNYLYIPPFQPFIFLVSNKNNLLEPTSIPGLRKWAGAAVVMAVLTELLYFSIAGRPAAWQFMPGSSWFDFINLVGSFAGVPAYVMWIGGRRIPAPQYLAWLSVFIGLVVYAFLFFFRDADGLNGVASILCLLLSPIGMLALCTAACQLLFKRPKPKYLWAHEYLHMGTLAAAMAIATHAGLAINKIIFPATWDYYIYRIDAAFFGLANKTALLNFDGDPWLQAFTPMSYGILIFAFYAVIGLSIRSRAVERLHVWKLFVLPFIFAFFLYAYLPVSGPIYTFFDGSFPKNLPNPSDVTALQVVIPPASRNGMPSMHLTGAVLIFMLALGLRHRVAMSMAFLLVFATAWATLALGEHYVLDLVVAMPYAAFLGSILIWPHRLSERWQIAAPIWLAGALFLLWMALLRLVPQWLSLHLVTVQALAVCSVLTAVWILGSAAWLTSQKGTVGSADEFIAASEAETPIQLRTLLEPSSTTSVDVIRAPNWIIGAFVASGLAGLIYEVIYAKALAVTFGSTALASYTVLATYMGGMALGAWCGGIIADKSKNPLKIYALLEAGIGIFAALTPQLFQLIQNIYVHLSLDAPPDAGWLTLLRVTLGAGCLLFPTILMGATMPLMFKYLRSLGVSSQSAIAPLYGANVTGAALGSVVAGYFLLPAVGRNGGTYIAAVISLFIALYVLEKNKSKPLIFAKMGDHDFTVAKIANDVGNRRLGISALIILLIGGSVTLGLEVNTMHLLAIVAGNSVYAFALMLATFLGGLGIGSYVGGGYLASRMRRIDVVVWGQLGVAIALGLTAHTWDNLPSYFSSFGLYPVQLGFSARETIRALVCALAMLPPAFFIGMSYPAAMSLASDWLSPRGGASGMGLASGLNTVGNIAGVILVGFWLLPSFGSRNTAFILALVALSLGLLALMAGKNNAKNSQDARGSFKISMRWVPLALASASLYAFPAQWNFNDLANGGNVYFTAQNWGTVIDHAESVEGGLTSVAKNENGVLTLLTNGKFQGNDSLGGEMIAQESFGLFPLLHTERRDSALVIGYGTGMTTRVLHDLGFKNIQVAELSRDIVELANKYFEKINHKVTDKIGVQLNFTDGRNFLLTQSRKFDLISIEITSIWFAGAANLYNQDFYHLAKNRLEEDGVLQQWVQLHHITPIDLAYVIGSVRSEFKYVWLYARGGQGIIIASNNEKSLQYPGLKNLEQLFSDNDERQPEQLRKNLLLSPAGVDNLISTLDPTWNRIISTDANLYLEHSTPKGNALGDVLEKNLDILKKFEPKNSK